MPQFNFVDGTVTGAIVQAASITGGVRVHIDPPHTPPRQLAAAPAVFVGRDTELSELAVAGMAPMTVLTGPGGVGKTTLARRWADEIRTRFSDGQLWIDLQGDSEDTAVDPGDALGCFLRALGVPAERTPSRSPERAALFRSLTAERSLLIVLDNAFSVAQVRALLPGADASLVVVTSRQRLTGLIADGAVTVDVRPWGVDDAISMLERLLGAARVEHERAHAVALARLCDGLPIALSVVAARLAMRPRLPLATLAAELAEEAHRLRGLRTVEGVSVMASLDLSYQNLADPVQAAYRRLGVLPGREYGPGPIAALAGSAQLGADAIETLLQANLLEEVDTDRFRQHDLLVLHARHRFETDEPATAQALLRRTALEWYLDSATAAERTLTPYRQRPFSYARHSAPAFRRSFEDRAQALWWLDDERSVLFTASSKALESGWYDLAWHLCDVLWPLFLYKKHYRDRITVDERGVTSAQRWGNGWAEADMRKRLGDALAEAGQSENAERALRLAVDAYRQAGDGFGAVDAEERIASLYRDDGRENDAVAIYTRVLAANRASGDARRTSLTLIRLGSLLCTTAARDEAIDHLLEARTLLQQLAATDPYNGQRAEIALARAYLVRGRLQDAAQAAARGRDGMRRLGSAFEQAQAVEVLARVAQAQGDTGCSRGHWQQALEIYDRLGSARADAVRAELGKPEMITSSGAAPEQSGASQRQ